jgi:hypothetical protein
MPGRAVIVSSDDEDGAGAAWISAKDTKEATDSRHAPSKLPCFAHYNMNQ